MREDDPPDVTIRNYEVLPPDPRLATWPYAPDYTEISRLSFKNWIPLGFNVWVRKSQSWAE